MPYFFLLTKGTLFEVLLACAMIAGSLRANRFGRILLVRTRAATFLIGNSDARAIALAAITPVVVRLMLLTIDPAPRPSDMEEFNNLLQANTYMLGRLGNPVHPLAVMLQSYQQIAWPHYMSARPPLSGLFLCVGALFGSPFFGNVVAVGLTSAALCWMLLGWLPRRWAVVGSFVAINTFCLFGYWVNSYWCPATMALGGALLMGAVPRVEREPRLRWAAIFIVGMLLLAGTRPYENGVFAGVVCLWLAVRFLQAERRKLLRDAVASFAVPVGVGGIAICLAQLGYDAATTGSYRLMPYQVWRASQVITPTFLWQPIGGHPVFYNPSAAQFARWEAGTVTAITQGGLFGAVLLVSRQTVTLRDLFGPLLLLPLLCWSSRWSAWLKPRWAFLLACWLLFILLFTAWGWPGAFIKAILVAALLLRWRNCEERLPVVLVLAGIVATSLPAFYMTVYVTAFTAPLLILIVRGLRHLSQWSRPVGPSVAGFLILGSAIMPAAQSAALILGTPLYGGPLSHFDRVVPSPRHDALGALDRVPGRLVVFVRTVADVPLDPVWLDPVWNAADVDGQRIVWLHDLRPEWTATAQQYYHDRQPWLMLMDGSGGFKLARYPSGSLPVASPLSALPVPDREAAQALGAREHRSDPP